MSVISNESDVLTCLVYKGIAGALYAEGIDLYGACAILHFKDGSEHEIKIECQKYDATLSTLQAAWTNKVEEFMQKNEQYSEELKTWENN